ncbi:DUF1616 domain-containing protein [Halorubrum sp. DTA98]|uniref:DUF1616 domain-containing protein n=1 Tax=Halorubrum sp. DTA98 TaxID=3402163 RepID=UPI003AAC4EF9
MNPRSRSTHENIGFERRLPLDLVAVGTFLVATYVALFLEAGAFIRVAASVVTICFFPGYVTTAALFPLTDQSESFRRRVEGTRITLRERGALSFGLSIALVPLIALTAGRFSTGFTTRGTFAMIAGYVAVVGVIAAYRRLRLPMEDRLYLPVHAWGDELADGLTSGSRINRVLTVGLVCSVLLAGGTFAFAAATPVDGERYTDFHLLTTNDDGEYVSAGYPEELTRGESAALSWGIKSYEAETTEYTVVSTIERVAEDDGQLRRIETAELDRTTTTVAPGEHEIVDHEISPPLVGENLRVSYYLYRGDAPGTPTEDTAYRHVHVWVNVTGGA